MDLACLDFVVQHSIVAVLLLRARYACIALSTRRLPTAVAVSASVHAHMHTAGKAHRTRIVVRPGFCSSWSLQLAGGSRAVGRNEKNAFSGNHYNTPCLVGRAYSQIRYGSVVFRLQKLARAFASRSPWLRDLPGLFGPVIRLAGILHAF